MQVIMWSGYRKYLQCSFLFKKIIFVLLTSVIQQAKEGPVPCTRHAWPDRVRRLPVEQESLKSPQIKKFGTHTCNITLHFAFFHIYEIAGMLFRKPDWKEVRLGVAIRN